ncbi:MAG: hypothetical protein U0Q07_06395 [Acidimicrobiales bacterium]
MAVDDEPGAPPAPEGLEATAAWAGGQAWVARRLFEVVGGWSTDEGEPPVRVWFAELSRQLGWHGDLFAGLLPTSVEHRPDDFLAAPDAGWPVVLDELAATAGSVERLAGLVRVVLAHLTVRHEEVAAATTEAAGGPVRRVLTLVGRDERDAWCHGEALLQGLLQRTGPDAVRAATDQQRALETSLLLPLHEPPG